MAAMDIRRDDKADRVVTGINLNLPRPKLYPGKVQSIETVSTVENETVVIFGYGNLEAICLDVLDKSGKLLAFHYREHIGGAMHGVFVAPAHHRTSGLVAIFAVAVQVPVVMAASVSAFAVAASVFGLRVV